MVTTRKYCRDCHFARNRYTSDQEWKCRSPKNISIHPVNLTPIISLITGEPIPQFDTCVAARSHNATGCGVEANWFMTTKEFVGSLSFSQTAATASTPRTVRRTVSEEDI